MSYLKKIIIVTALTMSASAFVKAQEAPINRESFSAINLGYPGLEKVKTAIDAGKYNNAATALLKYYQERTTVRLPEYNIGDAARYRDKRISKDNQEKADSALLHKFKPHKGYGYFDYGRDINWQLWPIKDNELRFQLHRVEWWQTMGSAYWSSGDEKYAKEWVAQFRSWVAKNPPGLSAENDRFAWRALEISARLNNLKPVFNMFVNSPHFTSAFLLEFLNSYTQQTNYMIAHYATDGNHLLFEAQRALGAGCFFPELKDAPGWRKNGADILNAEIKKQVLPDGMHFELATSYHIGMINTFLEGLNQARQSGLEKEFPESYKATIEKMIMAVIGISFPDYTYPMFGDVWLTNKEVMQKQYRNWTKAFPYNKYIQYFATDGKEGQLPNYLSHALTSAGFYTFRNGWNMQSTAMVLKAGPSVGFHSQPDNGTFELWVKGRNFTPDAGCYVYAGDSSIMKLRNWFRQTRVHSTLTLNNENMVITKAQQQKWQPDKNLDIVTYTNPSYKNLNHQRSVLFIDEKYFLIIDKATDTDTGILGTHFQLKEDSKPVFDKTANRVYTTYVDGNNLLIQNLNKEKVLLSEEEGKVSYTYMKSVARPAFVFEKNKNDDKAQVFLTLLYPFDGVKVPQVSITENKGNDFEKGHINIILTINRVKTNIKTELIK